MSNGLLEFRDQASGTLPLPSLDSPLLLSVDQLTSDNGYFRCDVEFIAAAGGTKKLPCETLFWVQHLRRFEFLDVTHAHRRFPGLNKEQDGPYFAKLEGMHPFDIDLGPQVGPHGFYGTSNTYPSLFLKLLFRERIGPDGFKAAYVHSAELLFYLNDDGGGDEDTMDIDARRHFYNSIPFTSARTWTLAERKPRFYEGSWQMH